MLALTGPYRALGDLCQVYVEFDLKIKDEGAVDEDFSKGLLKLNAIHGSGIPFTSSPRSYLSTVEMVCLFIKPWKLLLESTFSMGNLRSLAKYLLRLLKLIQVKWLCMTVKYQAPRQNFGKVRKPVFFFSLCFLGTQALEMLLQQQRTKT